MLYYIKPLRNTFSLCLSISLFTKNCNILNINIYYILKYINILNKKFVIFLNKHDNYIIYIYIYKYVSIVIKSRKTIFMSQYYFTHFRSLQKNIDLCHYATISRLFLSSAGFAFLARVSHE